MTDEKNVISHRTNSIMVNSGYATHNVNPTSQSTPTSPSECDCEYSSSVNPFHTACLLPSSSMSSLINGEAQSNANSSEEHTFLTPSLSMSSLQQNETEKRHKKLSRHTHTHHSTLLTPSLSMSSLTHSSRPRSLMENILIAKMERANLNNDRLLQHGYISPSTKSLFRTDSIGSTSSFTSDSSIGSEYCRCDDCLLGIADLSVASSQRLRRKKVRARNNRNT